MTTEATLQVANNPGNNPYFLFNLEQRAINLINQHKVATGELIVNEITTQTGEKVKSYDYIKDKYTNITREQIKAQIQEIKSNPEEMKIVAEMKVSPTIRRKLDKLMQRRTRGRKQKINQMKSQQQKPTGQQSTPTMQPDFSDPEFKQQFADKFSYMGLYADKALADKALADKALADKTSAEKKKNPEVELSDSSDDDVKVVEKKSSDASSDASSDDEFVRNAKLKIQELKNSIKAKKMSKPKSESDSE